jgi:hypothetical protein
MIDQKEEVMDENQLGIEDFESAVSKKDGRYLLDRLRGCNE